MSVLIKGMEMPESGTYEVSIDSANGKDKTVMSLFVRGEGGLICCGVYELVPVPKHGDLVDRDYVKEHLYACETNGRPLHTLELCELLDAINDIPTIIPAEEGE